MTKQSGISYDNPDSFKAKMNHTATPATLTTGSIHCVQKKKHPLTFSFISP